MTWRTSHHINFQRWIIVKLLRSIAQLDEEIVSVYEIVEWLEDESVELDENSSIFSEDHKPGDVSSSCRGPVFIIYSFKLSQQRFDILLCPELERPP